MKTRITLIVIVITGIFLFESFYNPGDDPKSGQYVIIGWNDLGMHCANKDFSKFAILPPYNNLHAQVVKVGDADNNPELVTTNVNVTYEVPGNTYSVGKTNFWDYEDQLFGVNLPDNTGLTGAGLSGDMEIQDNYFIKEGIPLTPYTDDNLTDEDPYQLALLQAYDGQNNLLASTQPVIPVSNEISCVSSGCHSSENDILYEHEEEGGFDPNNTPILCAECHSSNALGTPGTPGLESLSEVIHDQHAEETNDCYKCHPGSQAQCLRGVMHGAGLVCQDCHGSVAHVAQTIANGREPWLEEPKCGATDCHGPDYAEEPGKLFRQSKGHSDLYCSACHGSPHAILPSTNDRDNVQNIALQGYEGTLQECTVCHGVAPTGAGPHGILATAVKEIPNSGITSDAIEKIYPNPASGNLTIAFTVNERSKVDISLYTLAGQKVATALNHTLSQGEYEASFNVSEQEAGVYLIVLNNGKSTDNMRVVITK